MNRGLILGLLLGVALYGNEGVLSYEEINIHRAMQEFDSAKAKLQKANKEREEWGSVKAKKLLQAQRDDAVDDAFKYQAIIDSNKYEQLSWKRTDAKRKLGKASFYKIIAYFKERDDAKAQRYYNEIVPLLREYERWRYSCLEQRKLQDETKSQLLTFIRKTAFRNESLATTKLENFVVGLEYAELMVENIKGVFAMVAWIPVYQSYADIFYERFEQILDELTAEL